MGEVITISTSIRIAASIAYAWNVLTDFSAYPDWNPYLVLIEGQAVAGSLITVHSVPVEGAPAQIAPVDVLSVTPYAMRWEGGLPDRSRFKGDHWFRLEQVNDSTIQLIHEEHFSGSDAAAILGRYGDVIRANFERFNYAFASHLVSTSASPHR